MEEHAEKFSLTLLCVSYGYCMEYIEKFSLIFVMGGLWVLYETY
jgi:hypothetical protein